MILLLRIILVSLIIYLLVRSFTRYFHQYDERREMPEDKDSSGIKKISKETGEYVDYEDIDKK